MNSARHGRNSLGTHLGNSTKSENRLLCLNASVGDKKMSRDDRVYTAAEMEALARADALRWCAGMAHQPPNPPMEVLHGAAHAPQYLRCMFAHTNIFSDLIDLLHLDDIIDNWVVRYLLMKILQFNDFENKYPRLTAQRADPRLLTKLWNTCTDSHMQANEHHRRNNAQIIMDLCPYISAEWEPSLFQLVKRLVFGLEEICVVMLDRETQLDRNLHAMMVLLTTLLDNTRMPCARQLCFERRLFDIIGKRCGMSGWTNPLPTRFAWLATYAPLFQGQFFYTLHQLAVALHPLDLPVLQLMTIADAVLINNAPMHSKWRVLAHIKHFQTKHSE